MAMAMAVSFVTAASSPSAIDSKANTKFPPTSSKPSFRLSPNPGIPHFTKGSLPSRMLSPVVKAELNEVAIDGSSNDASSHKTKPDVAAEGTKDVKPLSQPSSGGLVSEEPISEFITQVASLVKLVDSRDIVELQLKQLDCEVTIRKKEALPQPPLPAQVAMMHSSLSPVWPLVASATPEPTPTPPSRTPSSSPPAVKSAKSSHPPLKCPMAGTFYRSPAPNEPPLVKVGDIVKKGQVLCIIEAMKLMNEIEADQSGTIVDILADDGKPVSVDTRNQSFACNVYLNSLCTVPPQIWGILPLMMNILDKSYNLIAILTFTSF